MPTPFRLIASSLAAVVALSTAIAAQQPRITNGRVAVQAAGSPFAESFRTLAGSQPEVTWIGYSVPTVDRDRMMCCDGSGTTFVSNGVVMPGGSSRGSCGLEPSQASATRAGAAGSQGQAPGAGGSIKLEGSERMIILYRVVERRIERIRVFSEDCALDAGGRPVHWLESVRAADSVALLESLTGTPGQEAERRSRVMDGAIAAIALHGDPAADTSLERLVAQGQPEAVRKKVTFWLGNARGRRGFDTLRRIMRDEPSVEVRKSAVFGLSQSNVPEVFDALAGIARSDKEPRLRSEALFWIAQKGDGRAPAVIAEALEKDSSPEVRKKAVFALSQLKDDSGVPALIQVARANTDAPTRGEAIFWLGQKAGRKAAEAITERIEQDPDTEVKKKAVFALSQLPKDEGVPLLITVARTNTNPAVRKQAMFWLGQSRDPRAVDFFAQILR
jgi:HEAT repeat protein